MSSKLNNHTPLHGDLHFRVRGRGQECNFYIFEYCAVSTCITFKFLIAFPYSPIPNNFVSNDFRFFLIVLASLPARGFCLDRYIYVTVQENRIGM